MFFVAGKLRITHPRVACCFRSTQPYSDSCRSCYWKLCWSLIQCTCFISVSTVVKCVVVTLLKSTQTILIIKYRVFKNTIRIIAIVIVHEKIIILCLLLYQWRSATTLVNPPLLLDFFSKVFESKSISYVFQPGTFSAHRYSSIINIAFYDNL